MNSHEIPLPGRDQPREDKFYEYYATASQSVVSLQRFRSIRDCVLRVTQKSGSEVRVLEVADIGCGAGSQSLMWAELGHRVHGLDVNGSLIQLARDRAAQAGYLIDFRVGSAIELPWADASMDVCLVPELLEHVTEWRSCLQECARILKRGGVLFLTTTNKLCPIQQEFNLPLYSWYPVPLKRYYERLAVTTRPELVNFAKYPAVNWFSFYSLRALLATKGFQCFDRFDVMDFSTKNALVKVLVSAMRTVPFLRWVAHVLTSGTLLVAIKERM